MVRSFAASVEPLEKNYRDLNHSLGGVLTATFCLFEVLRATASFVFCRSDLAQTNSVARIASPRGITISAGPGNTIIAMPISSTVKPAIAIKSFLIRERVNTVTPLSHRQV